MTLAPMVPLVFESVAPDAAIDAIADAHNAVIGGEPSGATLLILGAHSALETAKWGRFPNFNFAGIRGEWMGQWTSFATHEVIAGRDETWTPSPSNRFRAYPTLQDGAEDYLRFLSARFVAAWNAAVAGDTNGFVVALKAHGYFTAAEAGYLSAEKGEENFLADLPIIQAWLRRYT